MATMAHSRRRSRGHCHPTREPSPQHASPLAHSSPLRMSSSVEIAPHCAGDACIRMFLSSGRTLLHTRFFPTTPSPSEASRSDEGAYTFSRYSSLMPSSQKRPRPPCGPVAAQPPRSRARPTSLANDRQIGLDISVPEVFEGGQGLPLPGDGDGAETHSIQARLA